MGQLVKRFNARGLAALSIAAGRGRKPTYTSEQLLRTALRKEALPHVARETIRQVLHEAG